VSPVKYGLGIYIPEDDILHSHRREIRWLVFRTGGPRISVGVPQLHVSFHVPLGTFGNSALIQGISLLPRLF
jgi:hypothetical protein